VNTAYSCYLDFFGVTVSWMGIRIRSEGSKVSPQAFYGIFLIGKHSHSKYHFKGKSLRKSGNIRRYAC